MINKKYQAVGTFPLEKFEKQAESIHLTYIYITANFPGFL
jgi:hypothetical protein